MSQNLVDRAKATLEKIAEAEKQLDKVVEKYRSLLGRKSVKDRRDEYEAVMDELKKLDERAKDVRAKSRNMEAEASKFFGEWSRGLDDIENAELRSMSRERLSETQNGYGEIVSAGRQSADDYDVFVTDLKDQLSYLKLDMSDDALARLKTGSQDLRSTAAILRSKIRELKGTIHRYVEALS